jgi:CubicO group peptidase (beta-lactamase class C family)
MNDVQRRVQDAIDHLVASGAERGLQVAVYRHGQLVVDAVAGVADPTTGHVSHEGNAQSLAMRHLA